MTARLAITALLGYALSFGALTANAAENNGTFADVSYDLEPNCAEWKHEFCLAVNTGGPTKEKKDPARGDAKRFDLSALRILADASDGDASGVSDELRGEVRDVIIATAKETNTPLVAEPVASEIVRRWEEFIDSDEIGFLIKGSEVAVFGIGATIRNVVDKSHSEGIFTADVHVTITIAPNRTGRIYDDLDDAASENHVPLLSSFVASRRDEGPAYVKLLKDEYRNVFGEDVDRAASIPIRDGRCTEAFRKEQRLLTMDEYEDLLGKSNLEILASKDAQLAPVTDGKGNLASLLAEEVVIEFEPLNTQFYPFQREHLDFNLFIPPLVSTGLDVRKQNFYCINSHTSGFTTTLKRKSEASRRDFFLSLIPYVSSVRTDEPWLNRSPFYLKGMHPGFSPVVQNVGIPGSRIVRTASFRILWNDRDVSGWMMLVPFLFAVLMIQLQWLMLSAASCGTSTMIAGILLAQTIYMSQNVQFGNFGVWSNPSSAEVLGENNVVTSVIFLAYGIAGLYVSTIAMMAFINNAKGKYAWLHRHQIQIFNYLRLFGLLLTPLYIPILAIYSDPETGYQHGYDWVSRRESNVEVHSHTLIANTHLSSSILTSSCVLSVPALSTFISSGILWDCCVPVFLSRLSPSTVFVEN
mmetsp:Transcript_34811/g.70413  ORF Transcript_34811/g.70413 Transcript_34811/m.70413 type:complete len:640 (+) Transcript_34811:81-2000(+)